VLILAATCGCAHALASLWEHAERRARCGSATRVRLADGSPHGSGRHRPRLRWGTREAPKPGCTATTLQPGGPYWTHEPKTRPAPQAAIGTAPLRGVHDQGNLPVWRQGPITPVPFLRLGSTGEPTRSRSSMWPRGPTTPGPVATSRQRSRTHTTGEALLGREDLHADAPLFFTRSDGDHGRAWATLCLAARTYHACGASHAPGAPTIARMGDTLFSREDLHTRAALATARERSRTHGRSPVWRGRPTYSRTALHVPRTIPDPHMGEALFGGPTHGARTNAVSRDAHLAWPPVWDGAS
jgi:hypothetical protein